MVGADFFDTARNPQVCLCIAKLAEQADCYQSMSKAMQVHTKAVGSSELGNEERNLLSVAYKNVVGDLRTSVRTVQAEMKKTGPNELSDKYCEFILSELRSMCNEVLVSSNLYI